MCAREGCAEATPTPTGAAKRAAPLPPPIIDSPENSLTPASSSCVRTPAGPCVAARRSRCWVSSGRCCRGNSPQDRALAAAKTRGPIQQQHELPKHGRKRNNNPTPGATHGATTRTTLSRTNARYMHESQHTVATTRRHGASTSSHGNKSANATLTGASKRRNTRFPPRIPDTPHPPHTPPASVGEGAVEGKAGPLSHVAPRLVTAASRCDRGDDREGTDSGRVKCAYQAVPLPLLAATATLPRLPKGTLVALEARQRGSSNATLRQCRGTGAPRQGSCRRG